MKRSSTILAVVSGKGGVGKSVVAVNLAEALMQQGHSAALVDADLGQGACAVLLNETPEASVLDLVRQTAQPDDVLHDTASGVTLVQGAGDPALASGRTSAIYDALDDVLGRLRRSHTFVVIDAPAGTEGPVRWALDRADLGALVLVGEPTAIADTYRLAKLTWQSDPSYPFGAVVNLADTEEEARSVAERFGTITQRFTGQAPAFLGWVPFSAQVRRSVSSQVPAARSPGPVRDAFVDLTQVLTRGRTAALEPISS